jgi:uncharacterized membrane protein YgcG
MKSRFLLFVLAVVALSSCSTYKSGQTPDDVYYSPERESAEYAEIRQSNTSGRYRSYEYDDADDRWLRMRVRNPYRWNAFDDYDWNIYSGWSNNWNNPYSYSWNNYWHGYYTWNSWYNPYCRNVIVVNPKTNPAAYNKVRTFSLGSYTNTNYANSNSVIRNSKGVYSPGRSTYNNNNSYNNNNTLGTSIRKVFQGNNSGNGNNSYTPSSNDRPSRSYTPSNNSSSGSSSSSSSGGSSSGGGVSRPGRGG